MCGSCEAAAFPLGRGCLPVLVGALGEPLAQAPAASGLALRQAERAIVETAEHHAQVRLRPLLNGRVTACFNSPVGRAAALSESSV